MNGTDSIARHGSNTRCHRIITPYKKQKDQEYNKSTGETGSSEKEVEQSHSVEGTSKKRE